MNPEGMSKNRPAVGTEQQRGPDSAGEDFLAIESISEQLLRTEFTVGKWLYAHLGEPLPISKVREDLGETIASGYGGTFSSWSERHPSFDSEVSRTGYVKVQEVEPAASLVLNEKTNEVAAGYGMSLCACEADGQPIMDQEGQHVSGGTFYILREDIEK